MRKREKIFWIILGVILFVFFIAIPISKSIKNKIYEKENQRLRKTSYYVNMLKSVGINDYNNYLNLDENGYIQKPYFLDKEPVWDATVLQIRVNAYNDNCKNNTDFKAINRITIEKEFENIVEKGEIGDNIDKFSVWYSINDDWCVTYENNLDEIFDLYKYSNQDEYPNGMALRKLSPEQINILNTVYKGEKTVDEIEL